MTPRRLYAPWVLTEDEACRVAVSVGMNCRRAGLVPSPPVCRIEIDEGACGWQVYPR